MGERSDELTEAPRRRDTVVDVVAKWLGLRKNPAGVIFGTITVGAVLAGENAKGETVATSVEASILILALYWVVHAWSDDTGERLEEHRALRWGPFLAALEREASILRSVLLPVAALILAGLLGASDATALWIGVYTCAATLILVEFVSAVHNRLPASQVAIQTAAGAAFGCVLLALRFLVA